MQEKYLMKNWELAAIVLNLSTFKIFTGYSRIFPDISGSAATLTAVFSGVIAFLIFLFLLNLYEKTGKETLISLAKEHFGKPGQYILFFALSAYLLFSAALTLRETGEFIKAVSFPTAPLAFIFLFLMLGVTVCASQGFDAIGRTNSLILPTFLFAAIIIIVSAFFKGEASYLAPQLGYGIQSTFLKGLSSLGIYGDLIIMFMLAPFSQNTTSAKKTSLTALGIGILINIAVVFASNVTAPYTVSDKIIHPFAQLIKLFSAGRFFRRVDGYFMYLFAGCSILITALDIFFVAFSAKTVFSLPKLRPLAYPQVLIVLFSALFFTSRENAYTISKNILCLCALAIFILCFATLAAAKLQKGRKL